MRAIVLALVIALVRPATCEQPGCRIIFQDTFKDSDGGWDFESAKVMKVGPTGLVIAPNERSYGSAMLNLTFTANIGAYCMDVILPRSPFPDNPSGVGITFWAADYDHRDIFMLYSKGLAILFNKADGKFYQIYREEQVRGFKATEGAVNTLCVFAGNGTLALVLNNTMLKQVRAQTPVVQLRFGLEAGYEKPITDAPEIRVTSFKVLSAERP